MNTAARMRECTGRWLFVFANPNEPPRQPAFALAQTAIFDYNATDMNALNQTQPNAEAVEQERVARATQTFVVDLAASLEGKLPKNAVLRLGDTPTVLRITGALNLPMIMRQGKAKEVMRTDDHGLPIEVLHALPEQLSRPLMVFDSATQADSRVVLTELMHDGKPVVVAVHLNAIEGRLEVNKIASAYGRTDAARWITREINEGRLHYIDKKRSFAWSRELSGLQLPAVMQHAKRLRGTIHTEDDLVKMREEKIQRRKIFAVSNAIGK